jgi:hypothetical protein
MEQCHPPRRSGVSQTMGDTELRSADAMCVDVGTVSAAVVSTPMHVALVGTTTSVQFGLPLSISNHHLELPVLTSCFPKCSLQRHVVRRSESLTH